MTHSLKADCVGHDVLTVAKESYETEGYCIVDNVYPPTELDVMDTFFEDFKTQGHKAFGDHIGTDDGLADNHTVGFDDIDPSKELLRAIHPHRFSPQVKQWYLHPRIAQVLTFLLERPALVAQTMYYYKPPQSVGQGMHQDNFFLLSKPATCIATWTPLDDTDQENGCLKVVQGSHREEILCPPTKGDKKNSILDMVREPNIIPICMKRGQTLFFSGQLIHGSEPNYSHTRSRRTFIGHYVDNMTENLAKFYHPVLDMQGQVVSHVAIDQNGGPCQEVK
tara:strand:+ start:120 stop:956 length:837 start_codon:yes stop_codon:yes gene_type:complete